MSFPLEKPGETTGPASADDPRSAYKPDDGFVAAFFSARVANWLLPSVAKSGITPNQVTVASILAKLVASASYATGSHPFLVAGALLVQLSFVLDCLDGQLARHRRQTSSFGEWLDFMGDILGDVVLVCGVAIGWSARGGGTGAFLWSYAALLVLFYRHVDWMLLIRVLGGGYRELHHEPTRGLAASDKARVIEAARARRQPDWGAAGRFLDWLAPKGTFESRAGVFWAKRFLLFGNGERYLAFSVLGLLDRPEWILPAIVVWGGAVYPLITVRRWLLFGGR